MLSQIKNNKKRERMSEYNDKSTNFEKWTTKKLKKEVIFLHQHISAFDCFSIQDLFSLELIWRELEKRGYYLYKEERLIISKD